MNKKELLSAAFKEALTSVNFNLMEKDIAYDVIKTGMKAYAQKVGAEFTVEEIRETIEEGIATLNKADDITPYETKATTKKDLLDFAFADALAKVNYNMVESDVVKDVIKTGMKAYAESQGWDFTDAEIDATIEAGVAALEKADDITPYQSEHITKKDLLDFAFEEALGKVNFNMMDKDIAFKVIKTSMKAYAQNQGWDLTDAEIDATIQAGIEMLGKADDDFKFQTRMMPTGGKF